MVGLTMVIWLGWTMRLSLTFKLVIGVTFILFSSLAILQRKASGILLDDKIQTLREQSTQVSYSLAISTSEKIKRLDRHLRLILTHSALNTPLEARPKGDDMLLAGTLNRAPDKAWEAAWSVKASTDDRVMEQFGESFVSNIQKAVELDKIRTDEHYFIRMLSLDGQPLFVMLIRHSKAGDPVDRIAVGVIAASAFFDLVAPFKGSLTTAFLVDHSGVAYAHPNLSLTGAILKENPVVNRVTQKFAASFVDEYQDGSERSIASFDYVPRTNLAAVTSISLDKAASSLNQLKWSFLVLGFGLLLLAVVLAFYISYLLKSPLTKLRRSIDDIALGKHAHVVETGEEEISGLAASLNELDRKLRLKEVEVQAETHDKIYKEKMSAFHRLSTGLVNELRNPLIGVLGHAQLAREKIRDPESIRRHLDLIERDVRKTKELVEDISQFAGVDKQDLSSVNIYEAINGAIEQACRKAHAENVRILKNLESVSSVTANAVLLRKALMNVISSCTVLIKQDGTKEIIVRLENEAEFAKISMIFESSVIGPGDLEKIFDPFVVTEGQAELGLDLALARGILEAHDSQIKLEQNSSTHFQFVILLPKVRELAIPDSPSPFKNHPGLELKGLSFALPEFSMQETGVNEVKPPVPSSDEEARSAKIMAKQLLSKIPLENMKIKVRKPTLRT